VKGGCQGFIGPYPSAFLDKHPYVIFKSWRKDNRECGSSKKQITNTLFGKQLFESKHTAALLLLSSLPFLLWPNLEITASLSKK
jgi:hypothetical protein